MPRNVAVLPILLVLACSSDSVPEGFAKATGRLEATEIHVATKRGGRVEEVLVDEGDGVEAGQLLARMDRDVLEAELVRARRS